MTEQFKQTPQELTPANRQRITDIFQTPVWGTQETLHLPAEKVTFELVERDLPEPDESREVRLATWQGKLEERKEVLKTANPSTSYTIYHDEPTQLPALFEQAPDGSEKRKMYAGTTVTLAQSGVVTENGRVKVLVYPISYSELIACYNPDYAKAFQKAGLTLPYAGIGISVFLETTDGFFPATRRGLETPVYPARLYTPGGGPKPGQTSTEALLEEILEETGLVAGEHFDPSKLLMLALVTDKRFAGSAHQRPELVAYLPLGISYRAIEEIQHNQAVKRGLKETDVWGLEPISTFPPNLAKKIMYAGNEMCPPTEAGLMHAFFYKQKELEDTQQAIVASEEIIQKLQSYQRAAYEPSIEAFSK